MRSELLWAYGFRHGFSLRAGGVSAPPFATLNLGRTVGDAPEAVRENHQRFARLVGYLPDRLYEVSQVHGATVACVDPGLSPEHFRGREADAVLSAHTGCAVGVRVADCAAVLLADPESGAVAAVHAGWRGVVAEIVLRAVEALTRAGEQDTVGARTRSGEQSRVEALARAGEHKRIEARALVAAVFPCIGPTAFEVGEDVARQLADAAGAHVVRAGNPRPFVDLAAAVCAQLERAGLASARVERVAGCTFSEPERFFSFRRDGSRSGRHLAAILPRC